jgi:hypothetical protein
MPIKPNDEGDGPGRWIPVASQLTCPSCGGKFMLDHPVKKMGTWVAL